MKKSDDDDDDDNQAFHKAISAALDWAEEMA